MIIHTHAVHYTLSLVTSLDNSHTLYIIHYHQLQVWIIHTHVVHYTLSLVTSLDNSHTRCTLYIIISYKFG